MAKKYRLGIVGYGSMASHYHTDTCNRDDIPFTLTAVYDLRESQRELAKERGYAVFDNLQAFLDSRLFDMVLVSTSNNNHCPIACAAMKAGYHVMVEKPVALSCAEIEKMIAVSKECGVLFTVHHNRRWDRDFMTVRQAMEDGILGDIHTIESRIHPRNKEGGGLPGWRGFEDHGGGLLLDWGIHMLDQLLFLIKEPLVSVSGTVRNLNGSPVDGYIKAILTYESGLTAQLELSDFTPLWLPRWYVAGNQGVLSMDFIGDVKCRVKRVAQSHIISGESNAYTLTGVEPRPVTARYIDAFEEYDYPSDDRVLPQDWASLYKNLAGVLDGTEELVVKPEQVLFCFRVIDAIRKSSDEKKSVQF